MVGKRLHSVSPSTSKRSPVLNVEPALANRPKRNISPKNLDLNAGLSWREERELKKALYASLQEVKRPYLKSEEETTSNSEACSSSGIANQSPVNESDDAVSSRTRRQSSRQSRPSGHSSSTEVTPVKLTVRSTSLDESSQDSLRSSLSNSTQDSLKKDDEKKKYRAQRKFAQMQGYSPSSTPNHTPVKLISKTVSPMKLFPKRAKTEDFLTFLCLRGTNALPPHLDFFNYSRDDGDSSYPATPSNGRPGSAMRDSSPSSSSTGCSNIQEEGFDPPVLPVVPKLMTPNRKAARACAGTPEIARGFASVSPRKNTSAKASPLSGRKHRGKSSLDITPSKQTAKRSITSPRKLSPLRKSSIRSLSKTKTSDRITMKRRAVATLTSVARISPKKALRKKASIFNEDSEASSSLLPDTDKKIVKRKYERRVDSKKRQNIKHMRRKKKEDKNKESFIATRLPKRNASKRAFKLYMELDDIDDSLDRQRKVRRSRFVRTRNFNRREIYTDEVGIVGSTDESMDELEKWNDERTVRLKRKSVDSLTFDSEDSEISFPLKDKRKKGENKTEKKRTLKTDLFNKDSKVDKYNKPVSSVSDTSPRMNTRSSSTLNSQNLLQISPKKISSAKICANKKLIRIKSLKKQLKHTKKEKIDLLLKKKKGKLDKREKNSSKKAGLWLSKRQNKITDKDRVRLKNLKIEPFPSPGDPAQLVEIPAFYPSEEEFRDPIKYIQSIHDKAEPFGMCKIVPPLSWKPDSKVNEEMRFTTQKQYIHKMYHRYGPNVQQFESIKKHLESHGVSEPMPVIGGAEIDLCKLSATIHEFGGMQNVMEKKKWLKVADAMKIPKSAQDRGTKLYDAYCKFLLSYDTMSLEEKSNVEEQVKVERDKIKLEGKEDDCIVKGKNMTLLSFNRTARNALSVWFKDDPPIAEQVEAEFWKIVKNRSDHVVVHGGHVDLHTHQCSLFPSKRDNHYSRHQWNLNNLPYNYSSILKYLGPVPGISVPTLHIGMLYTASCWSTDIHYLPYVQYLHTESDIIWYSVPEQEESKFKEAMKELVPTLMKKEERWLKEDTVIVPPEDLIKKGVSIGRCVQSPRQFVVVFPKCYTSTVSCGYTLAESVHYTKSDWIPQGVMAAKELHRCKEQELFSMDELLCNMVQDTNLCISDLELAFPAFQHMIEEELHLRKQLQEAGLKTSKKMCTPELPSRCSPSHSSRKSSSDVEEIVTVCDISKQICYLSLVLNEADDLAFSLEEGLSHIHKKRNIKSCKLMYRHTEEELKKMLADVKERLNTGHGGSDKTGRRNTKIKAEDYSKS